MVKKIYIQPLMKAYSVKVTSMLAASNTMNYGGSNDEEEDAPTVAESKMWSAFDDEE